MRALHDRETVNIVYSDLLSNPQPIILESPDENANANVTDEHTDVPNDEINNALIFDDNISEISIEL